MALSVVEWFVAIIAVAVLVKVVLFNLNPKKWIDYWMKYSKNFTAFRLFYLAVFFVLLYTKQSFHKPAYLNLFP